VALVFLLQVGWCVCFLLLCLIAFLEKHFDVESQMTESLRSASEFIIDLPKITVFMKLIGIVAYAVFGIGVKEIGERFKNSFAFVRQEDEKVFRRWGLASILIPFVIALILYISPWPTPSQAITFSWVIGVFLNAAMLVIFRYIVGRKRQLENPHMGDLLQALSQGKVKIADYDSFFQDASLDELVKFLGSLRRAEKCQGAHWDNMYAYFVRRAAQGIVERFSKASQTEVRNLLENFRIEIEGNELGTEPAYLLTLLEAITSDDGYPPCVAMELIQTQIRHTKAWDMECSGELTSIEPRMRLHDYHINRSSLPSALTTALLELYYSEDIASEYEGMALIFCIKAWMPVEPIEIYVPPGGYPEKVIDVCNEIIKAFDSDDRFIPCKAMLNILMNKLAEQNQAAQQPEPPTVSKRREKKQWLHKLFTGGK